MGTWLEVAGLATAGSKARLRSTAQPRQNQPLNKVHILSRSLYRERASEAC